MSSEAVLVKLGGSLITDKTRSEKPRRQVIARLALEIARAAPKCPFHLIVGHGSGSFGHSAARHSGIAEGLRYPEQLTGLSLTQHQAAGLHRLVVKELFTAGTTPYSIAPSSSIVAAAGRPVSFMEEPLLLALQHGLLPVLYGDVVMDREQGVAICSTERVFETVAQSLLERGWTIRRALWMGETDGLWDAEGRTVPRLSAANFGEAAGAIGEPAGTDVTGGMVHRVETALALARLGIPSLLLNGLRRDVLEAALLGEEVPGTEVS